MTVSTVTLNPSATTALGLGAIAGPDVIARATRPDYPHWLNHVSGTRGCVRPVRLSGKLHTISPATGEVVSSRSTDTMPDGVIYVPCGDRRIEVCPACAETYRADTYHLIKSGLVGGKGVPETVATHPAVFLTLTAPSFGPVHTRTVGKNGKIKPCRMRRTMTLCPHGRPTWCTQRHSEGSPCLGSPLCTDCYDYPAHAVWNAYAPELWRRTTIRLRRLAAELGKQHGVQLDVSFGKVAEYQTRGVVHFHAIIRLDQRDIRDPDLILPPPIDLSAADLDRLIACAVAETTYVTPPYPGNQHQPATVDGWAIMWGPQVDTRPLARVDGADITETMVAAYVAKYATKATEATGFISRRLTADTITAVDPNTHAGALALICWQLGANPHDAGHPVGDGAWWYPPDKTGEAIARTEWKQGYGRLRRWAHMLGFGGHFASRSRRYGPTRGHLKAIRHQYRRSQQLLRQARIRTADHLDEEDTTLIVGELSFAGMGWLTTGDAELALSAAARAREQRQVAKQELACQPA